MPGACRRRCHRHQPWAICPSFRPSPLLAACLLKSNARPNQVTMNCRKSRQFPGTARLSKQRGFASAKGKFRASANSLSKTRNPAHCGRVTRIVYPSSTDAQFAAASTFFPAHRISLPHHWSDDPWIPADHIIHARFLARESLFPRPAPPLPFSFPLAPPNAPKRSCR